MNALNHKEKIIVFDWNGTLLDDTHLSLASTNHVLCHFGLNAINLETHRQNYDIPITAYYEKIGFSKELISLHAKTITDLFVNDYESRAHTATLMHGAQDILGRLKDFDIKCLILSNYLKSEITAQLERLEIRPYIHEILAYDNRHIQTEHIFSNSTQTKRMSKGEILNTYLATCNLAKTEIIVVGDTPEETHIARNIGATSIAISRGSASVERLENVNPDFLIHHIDDIKPILQNKGFMP